MKRFLRLIELVLTYTVPGAALGAFLAGLARVVLNSTGNHYGGHADPNTGWPYVTAPRGAALGTVVGLVVLFLVTRSRGRSRL